MSEYQLSAPALHAARTLLRHFTVRENESSNIEFSETNLAKLIDRYTFSWRVKQAVKELCSQVNWVPNTSNDVMQNLDQLRESVEALQMIDQKLPRYRDESDQDSDFRDVGSERNRREAVKRSAVYRISAVSVYAIRMIQEHFEFIERPDGQMDANEANLAGVIDVCTNIFRVQDALHRMCAMVRSMSKAEMAANMKLVRHVLAALDIACARMPGHSAPRALPIVRRGMEQQQIELSYEQRKNRQQVSVALHRTRTPEDALKVIDAAKSDKLL